MAADRNESSRLNVSRAYIFGAVNPLAGGSSALISPTVSTELMSKSLKMICEAAGSGSHVVLVFDRAGWHKANAAVVPELMALHFLPPYSSELNAIERLWQYLKSHCLSNRIFESQEAIVRACADA